MRGVKGQGNRSAEGGDLKAGCWGKGELGKDERGKGDLNWERRRVEYGNGMRVGLVERGLEKEGVQNLSGFWAAGPPGRGNENICASPTVNCAVGSPSLSSPSPISSPS